MSETEEVAKAVVGVARLGEVTVEASQKLGGFFAKVFKEPAEEIAGIVTDKLRFVRWKRLVETADEVNKILESRNVKTTRAVPPKLALPIIEESSLEDDPTLQALWSHLLANAMDSSFSDEIRSAYSDIIKGITGRDALLLRTLYDTLRVRDKLEFSQASRFGMKKLDICNTLKLSESDYLVSVNNLMRLRLIAPFVIMLDAGAGISISGGEKLTIDKGTDVVCVTPLGIRFIEACSQRIEKGGSGVAR